jgi:hypothetical protein
MANVDPGSQGETRRSFIKNTASAAILLATTDLQSLAAKAPGAKTPLDLPWYSTVTRWGQINITEKDPAQYDISWWREYWKRTSTKGIIVNAGGIVAYYPTQVPLHRRAEYLGGRDLFGEIIHAAHEDGVAVFARMDSSKAHEDFYKTHPGWFAVDAAGKPYMASDLYVTCVNSPYYHEHIPAILTEISGLYHPEGFTDNNWTGLGRESICYCEYCKKDFRDKTGLALPAGKNWDDPVYRHWIRWSYDRRLEIWDLNNKTTRAAGGIHCIWSGMNSGSINGQSRSFRDYKAICDRADILMLDEQARSDAEGFQHNGETGKRIHGMLGWDKLVPESMAMYQGLRPMFRLSSKPEPEARMWMIEGIAGGIQPWWHMLSAHHEDRRMHHNPEAVFNWHRENEEFLIGRQPVASIGLVWSQQNTDFYGRDNAEELVDLPWRGMSQALLRARIPFLPVHADQIGQIGQASGQSRRDGAAISVLILPNLAVMTDGQLEAVRKFVRGGGSLIATGDSSLMNEYGDQRGDYGLADLFGAHVIRETASPAKRSSEMVHTYLRLDPVAAGRRHEILLGFEETDILPFGGMLSPLRLDAGAEPLMTYVPPFPVSPPEKVWMREPKTDIPGVILNRDKPGERGAGGQDGSGHGGRVVFIPADLDRQYARANLPDHGDLLKNIILWAADGKLPMTISGTGLIDCHLYQQTNRLILHIVNLSGHGAWRQPVDEFIPIGPLQVNVKLPVGVNGAGLTGSGLRSIVSGRNWSGNLIDGSIRFVIDRITDHEVIVIS